MGTDCAPFVEELYLFIMRDFMLSESDIIFKLMVLSVQLHELCKGG